MVLSKRVFGLIFMLILLSCSNDDSPDFEVIPPRELAEVEAEDALELQEYLQTHFYNYEDFENPPAGFDFKIVLDTIAGANADKTALINQVSSETRTILSGEFGLEKDETVEHTFYYLDARAGAGDSPSVADSVFVRYRGSLLTGEAFDASDNVGVWFDLAQLQAPQQGARGFSEAIPFFKAGTNVIENGDGTVTVEEYGTGLIFMPSGLGFFNVPQGIVPAYSPLIFEIDLFAVNPTDHDRDGIPSIQEDLDGDGYLYNDNTDEEAERSTGQLIRFANFLDPDDDQDGTPTRDEIVLDEEGNLISTPDTDGDGIPDYLDPDTN
ncbi:MAG: hypothetical protein HKN89_09315 [Eudoraea sp.]|nr:hypothetical protein [Eudoraea sp.]